MKKLTRGCMLLTLISLLAGPSAAQDPYEEAEYRGTPPVTWKYRIQKRGGGGGEFTGWFLDLDTTAEPAEGKAANLVSSWHGHAPTANWEIRPAGEFNGVKAVYIINLGDDYNGWFLGIDPETGSLTVNETSQLSSTKWVLRWSGQVDKYDVFQIQNAGLNRYKGAYIALSDQAKRETGQAKNVGITDDGSIPNTFWRLWRQPVELPRPRYEYPE